MSTQYVNTFIWQGKSPTGIRFWVEKGEAQVVRKEVVGRVGNPAFLKYSQLLL